MTPWTSAEWIAVLGACGTLVGAIAAATVTVVRAVRGQAEQTRLRVDAHEEQSQARARELKATVERHTG